MIHDPRQLSFPFMDAEQSQPRERPEPPKCTFCGDPAHVLCGWCRQCRDHAFAYAEPCEDCGGQGEVALPIPAQATTTCPSCQGTGWGDLLSDCCGSRITGYDDDPT